MMALYIKLQDASSLRFGDSTRVTNPTEYLGWHAQQVQDKGIARTWNTDVTLKARVNHGRWIADCRACGRGMFAHPEWRMACCAECGAVYRAVEFPAGIVEITRLLLERADRENQNWVPGEPIWKLKFENFAHGVMA